jgi:hypothetical protein
MLVMRGRARYPSRGLFVGAEDLVPGLGPFETCQGTLDRKCWSCLGLIVAADYGHIVGQQRLGIRKNWTLFRTSMLFAALAQTFILGRSSVEFDGTGSAWAMLIFGIIALLGSLIGIAVGEIVRQRPKGN